MTGLLYFPALEVPDLTWLGRATLYWDAVAVVLPYDYGPKSQQAYEQLFPFVEADRLVRCGVSTVHHAVRDAFALYLDTLGLAELERRRVRFAAGETVELSEERFLWWALPEEMFDAGLARFDPASPNVFMESATTWEWSIALALGASHPRSGMVKTIREDLGPMSIVPATDDLSALAVVSMPVRSSEDEATVMRIGRSLRTAAVRTVVLEQGWPVPAAPLRPSDALSLRDGVGDRLSELRTDWEAEIVAMTIGVDVDQRAATRITERMSEQCTAVLTAAGVDRLERPPVAVDIKVGLDHPADSDESDACEILAYCTFPASSVPAEMPGRAARSGSSFASLVEDRLGMMLGYEPDDDEMMEDDVDDDREDDALPDDEPETKMT